MGRARSVERLEAYFSELLVDVKHASRLTTLVLIERNPGVCLEARFALAAEHPDHDPYECSDEDKKVDCPNHAYSPLYRLAARSRLQSSRRFSPTHCRNLPPRPTKRPTTSFASPQTLIERNFSQLIPARRRP